MNQIVRELSRAEVERVEAQRKWVREHFTPEAEHKYEVFEEKLRLLDTIIKNDWIAPSETVKLQSLGITLGDAFVQKMGFRWIEVEDEYGVDPAIQLPGTSIILFPLTMISKRIERGDPVDVYELFEGIAEIVKEKKSKEA